MSRLGKVAMLGCIGSLATVLAGAPSLEAAPRERPAVARQDATASMQALLKVYWNAPLGSFHNSYPIDTPGNNYWWQANAVDALAEGIDLHLNAPCAKTIAIMYTVITMSGSATTSYFDDEAWMGLGFLHAYQATKKKEYLSVAENLFEDIVSQGWQKQGGIVWNRIGSSYRNTPANAPTAVLGASLYRVTRKSEYLANARKIFSWEWKHLVASDGTVWDGLQGDTVNESQYSYNYGTVIGAAVGLWKDTKDPTYLNDAERVGLRSLQQVTTGSGHIIRSEGQGDGGLFNGIYIRYTSELSRYGTHKALFRNLVLNNAASARQDDVTSKGIFADDWAAVNPVASGQNVDLSTALSGVFLMNQADAVLTGNVRAEA